MENDFTEEVWRAVVGYEDSYEVSNFGRVRALCRKKKITRTVQGRNDEYYALFRIKPIKSRFYDYGYNSFHEISLYNKDGIQRTHTVARIVAQAFIPNPHGYNYVEHIDGNLLNNRADNLRWTHYTKGFKESNEKRKIPVICIETGIVYESMGAAAKAIGSQTNKISRNIRGLPDCGSVKGYHFKYA